MFDRLVFIYKIGPMCRVMWTKLRVHQKWPRWVFSLHLTSLICTSLPIFTNQTLKKLTWNHIFWFDFNIFIFWDVLWFQQHGKDGGQIVLTKLKCAAGLADLATKKYKSAAKYFLQANFDYCDFPEVSLYLKLEELSKINRDCLLYSDKNFCRVRWMLSLSFKINVYIV